MTLSFSLASKERLRTSFQMLVQHRLQRVMIKATLQYIMLLDSLMYWTKYFLEQLNLVRMQCQAFFHIFSHFCLTISIILVVTTNNIIILRYRSHLFKD